MRKQSYLFFLLLLIFSGVAYAHGISEADKQAMLSGGYLRYVGLGATHMLSGYDHLLFLLGVVFFLTKFKDILKFITAFTLGHSITLFFATYLKITANYYLVDAVIALSVCYKGFENLDGFKKYLNMKSPNLVAAVFLFGLIHGFGLSTRLQQLPLGTDAEGLFFRIISFNVGVELGQVLALAAMVFLISTWRRSQSFQRFSLASNFGLISLGGLLLIMQLHGYSHTKWPDDFGFPADNHNHAHIKMIDPTTSDSVMKESATHDHGDGKGAHSHGDSPKHDEL